MPKFRKKPVVIEAEQWYPNTGRRVRGVCHCQDGALEHRNAISPAPAHLHTIHQGQIVQLAPGDWIVPEADGEHFYPIKPDVFAATYEPVGEGAER
jgi:hypothetical protein